MSHADDVCTAKGNLAAPEAMLAAASHVSNEYGHYGYRLGLSDEVSVPAVYVFEVVCSDGSRFNLVVDKYGNVQRIPDGTSREGAIELIREMARGALAA